MKRTTKAVKIFKSFGEQEASDVKYYTSLSPEGRQRIARELRKRCFGKDVPRIRAVRTEK